jgi:hypothetical protein
MKTVYIITIEGKAWETYSETPIEPGGKSIITKIKELFKEECGTHPNIRLLEERPTHGL